MVEHLPKLRSGRVRVRVQHLEPAADTKEWCGRREWPEFLSLCEGGTAFFSTTRESPAHRDHYRFRKIWHLKNALFLVFTLVGNNSSFGMHLQEW